VGYHVFVERAQSATPDAVERLATAIAARYGLSAEQIRARLAIGRLRVKQNVDRQTAAAFVADLETLGAVCSMEEASADHPAGAAPSTGATGAAPSTGATGAARQARPARPPPIPSGPARTTPAPTPRPTVLGTGPVASPAQPRSALSESLAGAADAPTQDLGALDHLEELRTSTGQVRLAAIDGSEASGPMAKPTPARAGPGAGSPHDPFAPPDAAEEARPLEVDEAALSGRRDQRLNEAELAGLPPLDESLLRAIEDGSSFGAPALSPTAQDRVVPPPLPTAGVAGLRMRALSVLGQRLHAALARDARLRLAAGVLCAILGGFIPARVFWQVRVGSAQADLNSAMQTHHREGEVDEHIWDQLVAVGRAEHDRLRARLFNSKITALLLWAACGGGLGFAWFRKIPWAAVDRGHGSARS
jgi:hypothetical protein